MAKPGPISDAAESLSLDFNANAATAAALLGSDYRTNEAIEDIVIIPPFSSLGGEWELESQLR